MGPGWWRPLLAKAQPSSGVTERHLWLSSVIGGDGRTVAVNASLVIVVQLLSCV